MDGNEATSMVMNPAPAFRINGAPRTPQLGHTRSAKVVVKTGPTVALRAIPELEKPYVTTDPSAATTAISIRAKAVSSASLYYCQKLPFSVSFPVAVILSRPSTLCSRQIGYSIASMIGILPSPHPYAYFSSSLSAMYTLCRQQSSPRQRFFTCSSFTLGLQPSYLA